MLSSIGQDLRFTSFNCKGLNNPIKRSKVLHHLQQLGARVIFLQETHLKNLDHLKLKKSWVGHIYHSSFSGRARGTAIILHKSVPFVLDQTIPDSNGRYIIVTGTILDLRVAFVNVYAPNTDDESFFKRLFSIIPDASTYCIILGGDFNCWLDPCLDRSSTKLAAPSRSAKIIQSFMEEFSLTDIWRFLNPAKREYSFFSPVHHTFTRIDLFLIDNRLLSSISACKYDAIVLSDHAPLLMDIKMSVLSTVRPTWRLNIRLISNNDFVNFISEQIEFFTSTNKTSDISASLLWESLKAYIRGEIISYAHHENKLKRAKLHTLRRQILQLDDMYSLSPSPEIYKDRSLLQAEFDTIMTDRTTELMLQSGAQFFEHGDKAGKLLAHQIRQVSASRQISKIHTSLGVSTDPSQINQAFESFYKLLYTSECTPTEDDFDSFFSRLTIPTPNQEAVTKLGQPITLAELNAAIQSLQGGKCPGPDGYSSEFYKKFKDKLAPLLLDMYNESFTLGELPQTLNQATISLLLKKGKDPLSCSSYRPISLLNVDFKLLSKVLAMRLESILPKIINADQTGFIQNRHSFSNLRRLFNIIYNIPPNNSQEAVISLDAEKAFDRLSLIHI